MSEAGGPQLMSENEVRRIDSQYAPFKPFDEWKDVQINEERWARYARMAEQISAAPENIRRRAQEITLRAAAVETGAIEGLYSTDRGFTYSIAVQSASWDVLMGGRGEEEKNIMQSQLEAYEGLLNLATGSTPLTQCMIRGLHESLCRGQEFYLVQTSRGPQKQTLKKGQYKDHPNHVTTASGEQHAYAPVDLVPAEVQRLCDETQKEEFGTAHPILQAAYVHHALTAIHPFADGNGRVARALASVYTYRSHSIPVLISADIKDKYFRALELADRGNYEPFVEIVFECAADAIQLVSNSVDAAQQPDIDVALSNLQGVYTTKGGYTHEEVDDAGYSLFSLVEAEIKKAAEEADKSDYLSISILDKHQQRGNEPSKPFRFPVRRGRRNVEIRSATKKPADAIFATDVQLFVPKDADKDDYLIVIVSSFGELFQARIDEVSPQPRITTQMRAQLFAEKVISRVVQAATEQASKKAKQTGY